ncbi:MAG: flagellar biosynthesis protein FlhB [Candidatus Velthaea sp.]|jgi:flagellar biosynthetic protein FlhB
MPKPEQSEKATPKRRREAREKGQVARSQDVGSSAIFLVVVIALHVGFLNTFSSAAHGFTVAFQHAADPGEPTIRSVWGLFARSALAYISILGVAFTAAVGVALVANFLQFGLLFTPALIFPKFSKINPMTGFQRVLFSTQTFVNLLKQLLKLGVVVLLVYSGIKDHISMFYALGNASPQTILTSIEGIVYGIAIRFGLLLLVLGIADWFWQKRQLEQSLKMSKQEVKDEAKQSEGSPEIRSAVKQRQRASARRRMMAAVPRATVVVTNPTHFAVALEWDDLKMDAPVLRAKGADLMAKRIREIAREHNIPILENPPLARTLYDKVELDSPIPPHLYAAVAQVIAFVFKLKNRTIA